MKQQKIIDKICRINHKTEKSGQVVGNLQIRSKNLKKYIGKRVKVQVWLWR